MSQVDAYCYGCNYHGSMFNGRCCNYYSATGKLRGCPAGNGCFHHTQGKEKRLSAMSALSDLLSKKQEKPKKKPKKPQLTPEEMYEREKQRKWEAAIRFQEYAQGRQKAAIQAYKDATGDSNYKIAQKIGVGESTVAKWLNEYVAANWDKLAILGISKPEGL